MKAEFTSYGRLTITPENELENYALQKWYQSYVEARETVECDSVLHIEKLTKA
jgi:hypothetical protein